MKFLAVGADNIVYSVAPCAGAGIETSICTTADAVGVSRPLRRNRIKTPANNTNHPSKYKNTPQYKTERYFLLAKTYFSRQLPAKYLRHR